MTVIVGALCSDGVVIGSDSSGTLAAGDFRTIEQSDQKKVFLVGQTVMYASTGQVGMAQRFHEVLSQATDGSKFRNLKHFDAAKAIAKAAIDDFRSTECHAGQFGALVAFKCASGFHLCEFAIRDFQPEFKTPEMWFVSMGCGQPITDPFLAFLRKVLFRKTQPSLSEGLLCVAWALEHAIELNTGGIQGPSQIAVLRIDPATNQHKTQLLSDDELGEHLGYVKDVEDHIASFRQAFSQKASQPPPTPPPTPPEVGDEQQDAR